MELSEDGGSSCHRLPFYVGMVKGHIRGVIPSVRVYQEQAQRIPLIKNMIRPNCPRFLYNRSQEDERNSKEKTKPVVPIVPQATQVQLNRTAIELRPHERVRKKEGAS